MTISLLLALVVLLPECRINTLTALLTHCKPPQTVKTLKMWKRRNREKQRTSAKFKTKNSAVLFSRTVTPSQFGAWLESKTHLPTRFAYFAPHWLCCLYNQEGTEMLNSRAFMSLKQTGRSLPKDRLSQQSWCPWSLWIWLFDKIKWGQGQRRQTVTALNWECPLSSVCLEEQRKENCWPSNKHTHTYLICHWRQGLQHTHSWSNFSSHDSFLPICNVLQTSLSVGLFTSQQRLEAGITLAGWG